MDDASKIIDEKIASLKDWRGPRMKELRALIHEVDPDVVEEWKWMGSPVFNHDGILCVLNAHSKVVKMTFPKGARINDPRKVFNAELGGNARRAIDWPEGSKVDSVGLKQILRDAVAMNVAKPAARKAGDASSVTAKAKKKPAAAKKAPAKKK